MVFFHWNSAILLEEICKINDGVKHWNRFARGAVDFWWDFWFQEMKIPRSNYGLF